MKRTILNLVKNKIKGIPSVGITAYDYPTAKIINNINNVDFIIVGDTVGSTTHGIKNLNSVNMDMMITHCKSVVNGAQRPFLIGDMPFMSYQSCNKTAIENAGKFISVGMDAVKVEGFFPERINSIDTSGILTMAHLGLTPQSKAKLGGYKIQAKTSNEIDQLVKQSLTVQEAGAKLLLLEAVPNEVGKIIRNELKIPVYGIGAGNHLDGQLVIFHDLVGMFWDFKPKFVKQYTNLSETIHNALTQYSKDVVERKFPSEEHFYKIDDNELEKFLGDKDWKYYKSPQS